LPEGFGEAGSPALPEGFGELGAPPSLLRGFGEPGELETIIGEPRVDAAQSGPLDSGRRKRRRRRGRRSRPPVAVIPGQSAAPDSAVQPPIEDIESSDPEGE
jgi:hypothetical protein